MKYIKLFTVFLIVMLWGSCAKDLGNYDYQEINEVTITGIDGEYRSIFNRDTLRINPAIQFSNEEDNKRYQYRWIVRKALSFEDTIGRTRSLEYPVTVPPDNYKLIFQITDMESDLVWEKSATYVVGTLLSRGILLMGETEEGFAEVDLISMATDTTVIRGLLTSSGLPRLTGGIAVQHTGGLIPAESKLWVFTKDGSYFVDRSSFAGSTANNFAKLTYTNLPISPQGMHPVLLAPQINNITGTIGEGFARLMVTSDGNIYGGNYMENGGDYYANPINREAEKPQRLLEAAPFLLYSLKGTNSMVWYDKTSERFMRIPSFYNNFTSHPLRDHPDDPFPWNQSSFGRTLIYAENTGNTDGGAVFGNSYAIMKDPINNYFIYKLYVNGAVPLKTGYFPVKKLAANFERAQQFAFSSYRTVVFYVVDHKLFAYDYNPGNEKSYEITLPTTDQVTMIKFDTQINPLSNSLYIGTYNPTRKGTLQRYTLGSNPNTVDLHPVAQEKWENLSKIINWSWRAVN